MIGVVVVTAAAMDFIFFTIRPAVVFATTLTGIFPLTSKAFRDTRKPTRNKWLDLEPGLSAKKKKNNNNNLKGYVFVKHV
jgi:hypothetical protein